MKTRECQDGFHKEFVSAKISGETANLTNPALDRILDFAGETGLVVIGANGRAC